MSPDEQLRAPERRVALGEPGVEERLRWPICRVPERLLRWLARHSTEDEVQLV